jgi:lipopolysaccharide/colanic/teichoic acid biosynthesis glycosyltransferase
VLNNKSTLKAASVAGAKRSTIGDDSASLGMLPQGFFMRMLWLERKRTERSGRPFVLMLLESDRLLEADGKDPVLAKLLSAVSQSTRDTDFKGWYQEGAVVGVIFTEIREGEEKSVAHTVSTKLMNALYDTLSIPQINNIKLTVHVFPEDWDEHEEGMGGPVSSTLRLALADIHQKRIALGIKRLIDIVGSLAVLVMGFPVFLAIALAVKLTSEGPVLFRQMRLGQYGRRFTFLKFRSMCVNNDQSIHEEYVRRFIAGSRDIEQISSNGRNLYKLTADPRITPLGRFLRKTSLDELPQFLHVLTGEMSLVGPRPPVAYEVERYDLWHKRRLLAVKPGLTGLWQVEGRSKVKFDDMVRLDIRYARSWSLWLDFKILLQTPRAILRDEGAC